MNVSTIPPQAPQESWLKRKPVLNWLKKRYKGWRKRHQLPINFAIHLIGIPLTIVGVVLLFSYPWWGIGLFVLGYIFQWIGHMAEGNDVGEWAAIKRLLGLPYVGISPRWQTGETTPSDRG